MATYAPLLLSGSTNGRPVLVAATATPGTLIHTAVSGTVSWDEIYLWATNSSGSAVTLTIEWGGVTSPNDLILDALSLPGKSGSVLVVDGLRLNNGVVVRAFAGSANLVVLAGNVNRIT